MFGVYPFVTWIVVFKTGKVMKLVPPAI